MSDLNQSLTDLSATQEEMVSGGVELTPILLFQDTTIDTFGESQMTLENQDGLSATSASRTGYRFRQTTFAIFGGAEQSFSLFRLFDLFRRFF